MLRLRHLLIATTALFSLSAQAGWQHTDWKVEGDSLASLHEETGIEWLKLSETDTYSFTQLSAQMGDGGAFAGWRFPTINEVRTWMGSLVTNNTVIDNLSRPQFQYEVDYYNNDGTEWRNAMGLSQYDLQDRTRSMAAVKDEAGTARLFGNARIHRTERQFFYATYDAPIYAYDENEDISIFLVSDGGTTLSSQLDPTLNINNPDAPVNNVPVIAGGLVLLGLGLARRRTR